MYNIAIIGGGPSGLAAALAAVAKYPDKGICIIEKNECLGKKIYATGNGKCNITNSNCSGFDQVVAFFNSAGILIREEEEGRMYPFSMEAKDVVKNLETQIKKSGIKIFSNARATDIQKKEGNFEITYIVTKGKSKPNEKKTKSAGTNFGQQEETKNMVCEKVIIATGGKAGPMYGAIGEGYLMAKKLGHSVTSLAPILAPVLIDNADADLKGVRVDCTIKLINENQEIFQEKGQVQFTDYGISGIPVFNMTRAIPRDPKNFNVVIDLVPNIKECDLVAILKKKKLANAVVALEIFTTLISLKIGGKIMKDLKINPDIKIEKVSEVDIAAIAKTMKNFKLSIEKTKGWKDAQATKGGIPLEEIEMKTMESKISKGLFLVGEIVDVDGPCGGYNLQNAWETGIKAGEANV